ncbi:MAG: hypothetical protein ACM3ON_10230 [Chloroflexota bacterium]
MIDSLNSAPLSERFDSAKVKPCAHGLPVSGKEPVCCENLSGKEVKKVYLECENCFERVEHEAASDFVRKRFNNGSVEFSVACPTCGHANMVIDVPFDDYAFSGKVFDLSEALNEHDIELVSRYEQGMSLS